MEEVFPLTTKETWKHFPFGGIQIKLSLQNSQDYRLIGVSTPCDKNDYEKTHYKTHTIVCIEYTRMMVVQPQVISHLEANKNLALFGVIPWSQSFLPLSLDLQ